MAEDAINETPPVDPVRAVHQELGPGARWLAGRYFEPVRFPQAAEDELRTLHRRGHVVHVMRTTAWVNFLYLCWALVRRGLPPVRAVVNLRPWLTRPWTLTMKHLDLSQRFDQAFQVGGAGLVFLRESAFNSARGKESHEDPFPALVELARRSERPIFVVPELFLWEKWQQKLTPSIFDRVFGSPEAPGFLHSLGAFLRNYKRAMFRIGDPVDLKQFIAEHPDESNEVLGRKIRGMLGQHLARETRAVFGPPFKPTDRLIEEAMRDRTFQHSMAEVAQETGKPLSSVLRRAERDFGSVAAKYSPSVVGAASGLLNLVFHRIYDGIEVDEAGLERAMKAAARAPIVLVPSHKSHVDYLVMSYVLFRRGYQAPLVAAGANLSFFPLGPFLRHAGAFFLRRSFKGDKVYTAVFKAYLKKLVHDGIHHEFFPEGGRSRTGKLLQPKLGLFTWLVDAVFEGAGDDLLFVPAAIDYEKVVEGASYTHELQGGEKKAEDLKALLSAPAVLTERYGRIHVTFNEPISIKAMMAERGIDPTGEVSEEQKKALVRAVAHRVMHGIASVSTVTPHALLACALLAHRRRGVSDREITDRVQLLRRFAETLHAPTSKLLVNAPSSPVVLGPIHDAMRTFASEGFVRIMSARGDTIFQVEDERRAELSFSKNTLINLVAGRIIVAAAQLASGDSPSVEQVRDRAQFLSRLFKFEFVYPVGQTFAHLFEETVAHLTALGLVYRDGERLLVPPEEHARPQMQFLADLLRDLLESYQLTAMEAVALGSASVERKEFMRRTLESGRADFLAGRISAAEALSKPSLENALQFLLDQGYLAEKDKKLEAGAKPVADLVALIRDFIPEIR